MKSRSTDFLSVPLAVAITALLAPQSALAADYWWDSNTTTGGFGTTTGTWGTSAFWSTSSAGTATPTAAVTNSADTVNFGTATLNYGNANIAIAAGGVTVNSIIYGAAQTTAINLGTAGNALTLAGTTPTITVNNITATHTISSPIAGSAGLTKAGNGILVLSGSNGYTGGTTVSAGTLGFRNLASKSSSGTHAFGAGTTLGLGVGGAGFFTTADVDNAFAGTMSGTLSNVTVDATTGVGIDTNAGNLNYATAIGSVSRGLTKLGSNTLTLGSNNAYTGATTIAGGTLSIAAVANAGSNSSIGAFATTAATGLVLNSSTLSYTGATASTNRGFTINGTSTINVVTPGAKLTMGNFTMSNTPALTVGGGAGSSLDLGTFSFSTPINQTITANIPVSIASIASTVVQSISNNGSALLTVGDYSATTSTFVGGNIRITGAVAIGTTFSNTSSTGTITYTGNSFTTTSLNIWGAHTFAVGGSGTIGTSGTFANPISFRENATFKYDSSANQTLSGNWGMNTGTISNLNMSGSGTLKLTGTNTANSATAATGVTTVSNGILQYGKQLSLYNNNTASWTAAKINVQSGGTLAFNVGGADEFTTTSVTTLLTNLAASSSATNGMNAGSRLGFDTTNAGGSFTIGDVIADTTGANGGGRGLTKLGTGSLVLSNTNTYTGPTTVSAGVLAVNGSLANTTTTVQNTGSLQGSGSIGGSVSILNGGTLAPGNSIESLGVGALTFASGSTYAYELQTNLYAGTPNVSGDLTFSSGTLDITAGAILTLTDLATSTALAANSKLTLISYFGGWTGTELFTYLGNTLNDGDTITFGDNMWLFNYDDLTGGPNYASDQSGATRFVTMTVVPEPATAILGGLGLLALLRRRRND